MAKIIFTSRYHKNIVSKRGNLLSYMGTREGVEKMQGVPSKDKPPTKEQENLINSLIKKTPEAKEYAEYEAYISSPSRATASEFISEFIERNADHLTDFKRLVSYMANRPGAEKIGAHGLFSQFDEDIDLKKCAEEVDNHKGIVWTHVISLKREDAERLGYNNAEAWKSLIRRHINEIAWAHRIDVDNLQWYAAFHNTSHHPHVHIMVYSKDGKQGYLTNKGIENMRRAFAKDIFRNEQYHIYKMQSELRKKLKSESKDVLRDFISKARKIDIPSDELMQKIELLAKLLSEQKGKTSYGYLPKNIKKLVDEILHDLAENEGIKGLYDEWCELDNMKSQVYTDKPKKKKPIEENETFKSIKNDIINEAKKLNNDPPPKFSPQYKIRIGSSITSLLSSMSRVLSERVRDWYSAKHRTIDKKHLEEMAELDRRVVIDEPTDNYEDEDNDQNFVL